MNQPKTSDLNDKNNSYLPHLDMHLFFPKTHEICKKILNPNSQIVRNIFHVQSYSEDENRKFYDLKNLIEKDPFFKNNSIYFDNIERIFSCKELMIRYLNFSKYDIFLTLNIFKNFLNLMKKLTITSIHNIVYNDKIKYILNSEFIYVIGRDKKFRPIIVIDFRKYEEKILKKVDKNNFETCLINAFLYFFNFIIEKMLLPGQIEQWNIIIQIDNMNATSFLKNFKEIIYFIQICYPSRLHLMYVVCFRNISESSYNLIENFILFFNKERIILINKKKFSAIFSEISHKILKEFLDPMVNDYSPIDSINGNHTINNFSGTGSSIVNQINIDEKVKYVFPPFVNQNIIFESLDEKNKILMNIDEYVRFISDNKDFYVYNEEFFGKIKINLEDCGQINEVNCEAKNDIFDKIKLKLVDNKDKSDEDCGKNSQSHEYCNKDAKYNIDNIQETIIIKQKLQNEIKIINNSEEIKVIKIVKIKSKNDLISKTNQEMEPTKNNHISQYNTEEINIANLETAPKITIKLEQTERTIVIETKSRSDDACCIIGSNCAIY